MQGALYHPLSLTVPIEALAHSSNKYGSFTHLSNDEVIGYYYLQRGYPWEESVIDFNLGLISEGKDVIDVGTHIGTHTIPYASKARSVHSFEAQKVMYQMLLLNLLENDISNVIPYRMALGSKVAKAHITGLVSDSESKGLPVTYGGKKNVNYGGLQLGRGGEEVPMQPLDHYNLSNIGFMKVDVEGSEPLVFYGGKQTIRENQPIIMYESNSKQITTEMIDDLALNVDEISFSISDYCWKHLAYSPPYSYDGENFYLFPPTHNIALRQLTQNKIQAYGSNAQFNHSQEKGWTLSVGSRGPFPVFPLSESKFRCIFEDDGKRYYDAEVKEGLIRWNNGTSWSLS